MTNQPLPPYLSQQAQLYRLSKARKPVTVTDDLCTWAEQNFFIPETSDHRLTIAPYQQRALNEAMRTDDNGNFIYSTVIWSDVKKSIKSVLSACRGLYAALSRDWSTVYVIANDLKQADSRVAYYMRRAVELNPDLKRRCKINRYTIEFDNHSRIEAIPIDPSGEAGSNADLLIFSELWGWKHDSAQRMWTEMTLSPTKFGKSQRWVETYAGFVGESVILENLYQANVKEGSRIDRDIELYANGSILTLWNTVPRLSWQTPEYYQSEAAILTPSEFERVHRNKFSASADSFVPIEWWDSCKGVLPDMNKHVPLVIGIDAAVSGDCFAMVGVSRVNGIVYVRFVYVWYPPKNGQISFAEPMTKLTELCTQYNCECVSFDEYQMSMFAQQMMDKGIVYMRPFPQGGKRLESDRALYDQIRERQIVHTGDPVLTEHIMNANKEVTGDDRKLRIVKRHEKLKIDSAVALSMSAYTAIELEL